MRKSNREVYLELGMCVIGAIQTLHEMVGEQVYDLGSIIADIYENKITTRQMMILMESVEDKWAELEECDDWEEEEECDCRTCFMKEECDSCEEEEMDADRKELADLMNILLSSLNKR